MTEHHLLGRSGSVIPSNLPEILTDDRLGPGHQREIPVGSAAFIDMMSRSSAGHKSASYAVGTNLAPGQGLRLSPRPSTAASALGSRSSLEPRSHSSLGGGQVNAHAKTALFGGSGVAQDSIIMTNSIDGALNQSQVIHRPRAVKSKTALFQHCSRKPESCLSTKTATQPT